tara:strand:- start:3262 stop:3936 length:675 start_codon:yes stop_codon:yes gene_type:complete
MLQKTDKKKYIFFYFIIFLILSSIHNSNLRYNNFFVVKKIEVVGLDKSNNLLLEKKLLDLIGYNIFTLKRESFKFINSINFVKDYNVKKIYPNQIKVYLVSAEPLSIIEYLNEVVVLGNNEKIINLENFPTNLPKVTGTNDIKKVFQTLKMINKSNLDIENIKKIKFFPSDRIDVEFRNNIKIRFPVNFTIDNLNFSLRLLENSELNKPKILDLRIPNKVITYD